MTRMLLTAVLLAITATSVAKTSSPTEKRVAYWQQKLNRDLPVGSSRVAITKWVAANSASVSGSLRSDEYRIHLENVPVPKSKFSATVVVCNSWDIFATMKVDAQDRLVSTQVGTIGHCL